MKRTLVIVTLFMSVVAGASAQSSLQNAVDFLYQYMPAADKANHGESFWRDQARYALYARIDMPWGEQVPDSLWRHYVLPPRVNNEELDMFRSEKYTELRERVQNLSMREAALEVNHWCHEYVTYRPSDSRTMAPLATLRTGWGRCGEESVLAVAAMRAVGIPARQVYTPRWAHTDDNHAWIEVWVDGKWYFMGACEPEPVLNMAWFNTSAARAMLLHTQVTGDWRGPEDVISRNECSTEINVIANYVPTRRSTVSVLDSDGQPVEGASVEFKIFNYSEFFTVVRLKSDSDGKAALTTGLGDMLVWASKDGRFGYALMDSETTTVTLSHEDGDIISDDFDLTPPAEGMVPYEVTDEQIAANKARLALEDSIRGQRVAAWDGMQEEAKGRYTATPLGQALWDNITEKDRRDISPAMFMYALENAPECRVDSSLYGPYVLSPRIEMEPLVPFRADFSRTFWTERPASAEETVAALQQWVQDSIQIVPMRRGVRFTPQGVADSRQADTRSRDIFFVALCRQNGIAARIEPTLSRLEFHNGQTWLPVKWTGDTRTSPAARKGKLRLNYTPTDLHPDLTYYRHFTLTRIEDGVGRLLNYEEGEATEMGTTMTASRFSVGQPIEAGYYMLTTGNRMADGSVKAHIRTFNIRSPRITAVNIFLREAEEDEVSVKGYFNADPLLPLTGRGYYLLTLTGTGEPTSHARQELAHINGALKAWGRPVVTLDGDEKSELANELRSAVNSKQRTLPIVVIADSFGRIVFYSEGYNTSLAEQLKPVLKNLK